MLALHDGRAGNARQALALARILDPQASDLALVPQAPWAWAAPRRLPAAGLAFGAGFRDLLRAAPGVVIGCGRQAALATRLLCAHGSRAVQILDPRIDSRHWDIVIAPEHDGLRGGNVLPMLGSLNPVDDDWLLQVRAAFPQFDALPAPRTVLLVGGPTRHAPLDDAGFHALLRQLAAHARAEGGSLGAVASRRTPATWRAAIAAIDADLPGLRWGSERDGPNPYAGLLAHADRIVCTPDSVNMLSEAAATRAPVFVWRPDVVDGRPRRFLDALQARDRVRPLEAALTTFAAEPLRETARIAGLVRERLSR